jgi:PAS domain S-box-containing protein
VQILSRDSRIIIEAGNVDPPNKDDTIHVLHVDDDPSILEISKEILAMEGMFEIDTASSVNEALKKLQEQSYDAVVSDYEMPEITGLDFLKTLREQKTEIPFILFTGRGREDAAVTALNLGADRYVNKGGTPRTVYCELADAIKKTVERKKSKQLLIQSERNYRMLVESSLQGILVTRSDPLQLVFANQAMASILGYSIEELLSLSPQGVAGLIHADDRTVFFKRLQSRFEGEKAQSSLEFRAVRKDDSVVWLEAFSNRIEYKGQPAVQGFFLDIDERKKAHDILRESEERYRDLANSLPDIVFEADLNGKLTFLNQSAFEMIGYTREEFEQGLNIFQFPVPEDRERAVANSRKTFDGEINSPIEYRIVRKDGSVFTALVRASPRFSNNKVVGLRALVIDISERKKAEEMVRKSEERYRELANSLPEIVFECQSDGKLTFFNDRAFEITGYSADEFAKGLNVLQFLVPEDRERARGNMQKVSAGETLGVTEYKLLRKNGVVSPILVKTASVILNDNSVGLRGLVMDITDRKKAE